VNTNSNSSEGVLAVVLDYCGGARTDRLVEQLQRWNPGHTVGVLDNASPHSRSRYITHQNLVNSYVGGGICDCVALARRAGCHRLLFIANDVECVTPVVFDEFLGVMNQDPRIVQVSAAITEDSRQASPFPWMVARGGRTLRTVPQADLLVALVDLTFLARFGGFPVSRSGWGYPWELAFHARTNGRRIVLLNRCIIRHEADYGRSGKCGDSRADKGRESLEVYTSKYGCIPWGSLRTDLVQIYLAQGHRFERRA
jgi:hypothetical protein